MEKYNITSNCPPMSELARFDTSNQGISGKFIIGSNGDLERTKPQVKNNWLYYQSPITCIDCNIDLFHPDIVKIILIEPNSFTYVNKTEVSTNGKMTYFQNRIVQGCNTATMSYDPKWGPKDLYTLILYFYSNCTMQLPPGNQTKQLPLHKFLPKDSIQWQINQYQNDMMNKSKGNCITQKCDTPAYGRKW